MRHLTTYKLFESQRVMGFKLGNQGPKVNCIIHIEAPDAGNIKFKLMDLLDYLNVDYNSVTGGGGRFNNYRIDANLYDEKEAESIINDLRIKLLLANVKVGDATFSIKETPLTESIKFNKQPKKKGAKTEVYNVSKNGTTVGVVKWSSRNRGYAFLPTTECELEVKEFVKDLMKKRRENKKK